MRFRRLRQALCEQQRQEKAHARAHIWQAIYLQSVWQVLYTPQLSQETHEGKGHFLIKYKLFKPLDKRNVHYTNNAFTFVLSRPDIVLYFGSQMYNKDHKS